eukprot:gene10214-12525_t
MKKLLKGDNNKNTNDNKTSPSNNNNNNPNKKSFIESWFNLEDSDDDDKEDQVKNDNKKKRTLKDSNDEDGRHLKLFKSQILSSKQSNTTTTTTNTNATTPSSLATKNISNVSGVASNNTKRNNSSLTITSDEDLPGLVRTDSSLTTSNLSKLTLNLLDSDDDDDEIVLYKPKSALKTSNNNINNISKSVNVKTPTASTTTTNKRITTINNNHSPSIHSTLSSSKSKESSTCLKKTTPTLTFLNTTQPPPLSTKIKDNGSTLSSISSDPVFYFDSDTSINTIPKLSFTSTNNNSNPNNSFNNINNNNSLQITTTTTTKTTTNNPFGSSQANNNFLLPNSPLSPSKRILSVEELLPSPIASSPFRPHGLFNDEHIFSFSPISPQKYNNNEYNSVNQNLTGLFQQQTQNYNTSITTQRKDKYERLITIEVIYDITMIMGNTPVHKKTVTGYNEKRKEKRLVTLYGEWIYTPITAGSIFNIIGDFEEDGTISLTNQQNLLILHPDSLITGTELGGSFSCSRRSILKEQFRWLSDPSAVPVFGSIVHEIFQECLIHNAFSLDDIIKFKNQVLLKPSFALNLSTLGETHESADAHVDNWIPTIDNFYKTFCLPNTYVKKNQIDIKGERWNMYFTKILEIEENIWSPMYGLKGKIDSTVEVKLIKQQQTPKKKKQSPNRKKSPGSSTTTSVKYLNAPLEIKTGKPYNPPYISHTSQVLIYMLLMNDRYDQDIELGLLYYLKNQENKMGSNFGLIHPILFDFGQIRSLIVARNLLAHFLQLNSRLMLEPSPSIPKMIREPFSCSRCFVLEPCVLYHKAIENGDTESSGLGEIFNEKTQHLKSKDIEYLKLWNKMITLESEVKVNNKKFMWSKDTKFSEDKGSCIGSLTLESETVEDSTYFYKFRLDELKSNSTVHLSEGDGVTISIENHYYGIGAGKISKITLNSITIKCREKISEPPSSIDFLNDQCVNNNSNNNNNNNNQPKITFNSKTKRFRGLVDIEYERNNLDPFKTRGVQYLKQHDQHKKQFSWRIDIGDTISSFSALKSSLFSLFLPANEPKRQLIIDLEPPKFLNQNTPLSTFNIDFQRQYPHLNSDQQKAILKVLSACDYSLIHGMPGTGKTTTISALVSILSNHGKTVLISSFTNTALDHLLMKLTVPYLRLASHISQVHQNVLPHCLEKQPNMKTITDIKEFLDKQKVVAATCVGMNHAYFTSLRRFDYCIIDEASQLSQPVCFTPICKAKVFILVGDHYQLPPIIVNSESKKYGMDISLFKRLSIAHPNSVSTLNYQYRMCKEIMEISNSLIYNDQLKCGNQEVSESTLDINPALLKSLQDSIIEIPENKWLYEICRPDRKVLFLNTDELPAPENSFGDLYYNKTEARVLAKIVNCLTLHLGIKHKDIGIISFYRLQIKFIREEILSILKSTDQKTKSMVNDSQIDLDIDNNNSKTTPPSLISNLDIQTIDKYQGSDKDCIVISLVRSNKEGLIGDLLKDWRRVNVAFTRVKKKLLIIGSRSTFSHFQFYSDFFALTQNNKSILDLPLGSLST